MLVRKKYIDIGQIKGCLKHGQIASNLGKHSQSVHGCICLHQVVHIILKAIGYIFPLAASGHQTVYAAVHQQKIDAFRNLNLQQIVNKKQA